MIDKYIAELLKNNTRVIVPDFGAFMVKGSPGSAEKQVSFNDFLKYNDGLLVNYIVKQEGIVKDEALKKVQSFVADIQKELKNNKPYKVADLGYLYKDPRGSVRFKKGDESPKTQTKETETSQPKDKSASQPSKTSVTLDDQSKSTPPKKDDPKVEKKGEEGSVQKQDTQTPSSGKTLNDKIGDKSKSPGTTSKTQVKSGIPESKKGTAASTGTPKSGSGNKPPQKKPPQTAKPGGKQNNSTLIIITAAIVVVLGAGAVIAYLNWNEWFPDQKETEQVAVDSAAIKARQAKEDSIRMAQKRQDSIEKARRDSIQKAEALKKKNQKKYYLVAGSFKMKKYANMFVEKLRSEGYDSEIFMQRRGFYRVSYNSYVDRQKAFNEYRRMKNQDIQVWVLRH